MLHPWSSSLESPSTLHRIQSSSSHSTSHPSVKPHRLSLSSPQRGDSFRSMSFVLDPPSSPKQFVRISPSTSFHRRRPRYSSSGFNSRFQCPPRPSFFFKPRPRSVLVFTLHQDHANLGFFFFVNSCSPLEFRQELVDDVGTTSFKGGIEG